MLYVREDYSLLVDLGDIGGLLDVVLVLGWVLSHKVVLRLLHGALVGKVYRLQHYLKDMTPYYKSRMQTGSTTPPDQWTDTDCQSSSSDGDNKSSSDNSRS